MSDITLDSAGAGRRYIRTGARLDGGFVSDPFTDEDIARADAAHGDGITIERSDGTTWSSAGHGGPAPAIDVAARRKAERDLGNAWRKRAGGTPRKDAADANNAQGITIVRGDGTTWTSADHDAALTARRAKATADAIADIRSVVNGDGTADAFRAADVATRAKVRAELSNPAPTAEGQRMTRDGALAASAARVAATRAGRVTAAPDLDTTGASTAVGAR